MEMLRKYGEILIVLKHGDPIAGMGGMKDCEAKMDKCRKYCWHQWWVNPNKGDFEFDTYHKTWGWCDGENGYGSHETALKKASHKENWDESGRPCGWIYMCCDYCFSLYGTKQRTACPQRDTCIKKPMRSYWCGTGLDEAPSFTDLESTCDASCPYISTRLTPLPAKDL